MAHRKDQYVTANFMVSGAFPETKLRRVSNAAAARKRFLAATSALAAHSSELKALGNLPDLEMLEAATALTQKK